MIDAIAAWRDGAGVWPAVHTGDIVINKPGTYEIKNRTARVVGPLACDAVHGLQIVGRSVTIIGNGNAITCHGGQFGLMMEGRDIDVRDLRIDGPWLFGVHSHVNGLRMTNIRVTGPRRIGINVTGMSALYSCDVADIGGATDEDGQAYATGYNIAGEAHGSELHDCAAHEIYRQATIAPEIVGEGVGITLNASVTRCRVYHPRLANVRHEPNTIGIFGRDGSHRLQGVAISGFETDIMMGG